MAKSKRLGRDLSIKVTLQGTSNDSRANSVRALEWGEDYNISWPALLFLDPLSPACHLAFKGKGQPCRTRARCELMQCMCQWQSP